MSRPRPVYPGQCYMVTRRCSERRFFLAPDKVVNESFWYILGWAAAKYGVGIVAACAMSNHYHLEVNDPNGCFPDFLRDFNAMLARCINAYRGRWENFWNNCQTSMVLLTTEQAQVDKAAYVLANPANDDLVDSAHSWPGATAVDAIRFGRTITAKRPRHFFRGQADSGSMPESVTITFVPPTAFEGRQDAFVARVSDAVTLAEKNARAKRRAEGRGIVTRKGIRRQRWYQSPTSAEPRRRTNPRVAGTNKWARTEALQRNRNFEIGYQAALLEYRAGLSPVFPAGTWLMARLHNVPVADPSG